MIRGKRVRRPLGPCILDPDVGRPNLLTQTLLPFDVGASCFPFLFTEGATPVIVANSIGKTNLLGESQYFGTAAADPPRASTHLLFPGLPTGTVLTFQALMIDPGSASAKLASASNGVIVEFVP